MPTPTESAELILKLYDLRREPVLREARAWFTGEEFLPATYEELSQVVMGEKSPWFRMVISYWDMAASLVTFGAIDQEMFNASSGEMLAVFCKVEPFLGQVREQWNAPDYLKHLEDVARRDPRMESSLQQVNARRHAKATAATPEPSASED
jgi:hypothetical protein